MAKDSINLKGILKALGPGILFAGAAIGVSHLVQSTRAGASYGFQLIWIIVLINIFKYPFFEFGHRFTAATGESMLIGYRKLGKWVVIVFYCLIAVTAVLGFAAVSLVMSGLASTLFNISISQNPSTNLLILSTILLVIIFIMLLIGRYALLDKTMKLVLFALSILTVTTFLISLVYMKPLPHDFVPANVWDKVGIAFLIALMGWMPSPIEGSVFTSLWAIERRKQTGYKPTFKETMIDFHVGYIGSAVMALFFLGLGATVMYGSGETFSSSTFAFSQQLVSIYSKTLGAWSHYIISAIAMLAIFSTTLTIIDALPRTIAAAQAQIVGASESYSKKWYWIWAIILAIGALIVLGFFSKSLIKLLDFATIMAFLTAPVFAIFNYKVVNSAFMPDDYHPKKWLRVLSLLGIFFLIGFCLLFIYSRIFL